MAGLACTSEPDNPDYWGASAAAGSSGASGAPGGSGGDVTGGAGGDVTGGAGGDVTGGAGGDVTGGAGGGTTGGSGGGSADPYAAQRAACIAKINQLRATKGLSAYGQWTSAEACVDTEVTADQASNDPHGSFGQCGESGQNECMGGGIESCLDMMWAEKDRPGCAGCDACAGGYDPNCPNCDFYGELTNEPCGHYVNMSAQYFSEAACGFSDQGWAAIDFR